MPSMILTRLQTNFIGIILRHICSPVNLLHNFGTPFIGIPMEGCLIHPEMFHKKDVLKSVSKITRKH